ncbi:MAG TPA: DsrE family protein [Cellulomonas sp.]|uniref:DsrE family protein n=1 Tax=Cellulomonas sp. TaxID=40001 RepID=UPI002E359098|nr:DsrE family protein [Cellulomonas sp.]HEX5333118.1 DsrE family protein [Cellulomonas sp.]
MTAGVVLHLTEAAAGKQRAVLRNALNLLPEVEVGTPIEVVVHGEAITLARPGQATADALAEAQDAGITIVVCRNSLRSQDLTDRDLVHGAVVVPSGVAHLVARQLEGWAYLRP